MKKMKAIFISILFTISASANAVIVDNGQFTTDTSENLDWLDLGFTTTKSYFDIESLLTSNPTLSNFQGFSSATSNTWALATSSQFDTLIFNFTGLSVDAINDSTSPKSPNLLNGLIDMLGKTYQRPNSPLTVYGSSGMIFSQSTQGNLITTKSLDRYLSNAGVDTPGISTGFFQGGNTSSSVVGAFLVRTSQFVLPSPVSSVPEPETYAMFLAGLGLLGFARSRRAK